MGALKPLMPSLREKKRYLAFEVVSNGKIKPFPDVNRVIQSSFHVFIGDLGAAKAGLVFVNDRYNDVNQRGLVRVNHKWVDPLKASLTLIKDINHEQVIVRSVGASGILNKAFKKYIAG